MSNQEKRQYVRSEQLVEHLWQIVEVPENVTGMTIYCEMNELTRIEWRTLATPVKDSKQ